MVPTSDDRWLWRTTEKKQPAPVPETASAATNDIVLAITRPMPKFTPRMEPCIIVQDYSGDFDRMVRMAGISAMVSEAKELFDARVRQDETALREAEIGSHDETFPMRHTTTTSVRGFQREGRGLDPPPRIDASPDAGGRLM
jgi:hypothetical protein